MRGSAQLQPKPLALTASLWVKDEKLDIDEKLLTRSRHSLKWTEPAQISARATPVHILMDIFRMRASWKQLGKVDFFLLNACVNAVWMPFKAENCMACFDPPGTDVTADTLRLWALNHWTQPEWCVFHGCMSLGCEYVSKKSQNRVSGRLNNTLRDAVFALRKKI